MPSGRLATPITWTYSRFLRAKHIAKQIRHRIRHRRLIEKITRRGNEHAQPNHPRHAIERAQMLLCRRQHAQRRDIRSISPSLRVQFFPQPPNILRLVIHHRQHAAEEKQVSRLHRLHIRAKRSWRRRKLNAKFLQPAIRAARSRTVPAHHRPTCAPSST